MVLLSAGTALSHSTKSRMKIPLDKKTLEIDDIAYFVESYVHRELYKHKYGKAEKRFYVNKFYKIEQNGSKAVIYFRTLDNKRKNYFDDEMAVRRQANGIWVYENAWEMREMYTYVKKTGYYYKKYVLPIGAVGIGISFAVLVIGRIAGKNKKSLKNCS